MENTSNNFNTLFSDNTDLNADSVEWCPHIPNQNVFVCGNYQLIEETEDISSKRLGKILLFTFSNSNGLKLHQTVKTTGVLDQKWCHNKINDHSILGVVTATGHITIYKLNSCELLLILLCTYSIVSADILLLSLDWSTGIFECNEPSIICSDSKGSVHLLKYRECSLELLGSWKHHTDNLRGFSYEAWIAGFYYWDTNMFFSGGDDGIFFMYDRRIKEKSVGKNSCHQAGVTSLHSNALKEHVVATGSYDQHIRLWDIRNIKEEMSTIKMPGEVWRLKWEPFERNLLLAACMYNGVHIVDFSTITDGKIVGSYYEHKNISYGADWSYINQNNPQTVEKKSYIIGSCSFYDKLLCISQYNEIDEDT